MNNENFSIKPVAITFVLYIVATVTMTIVLTAVWQTTLPEVPTDYAALNELAINSEFLSTGTAILGVIAGIACAFFLTLKTKTQDYKYAIGLGICFVAYGALSIFLHPEHELARQVGKLVSPIPLCMLGAWLAIKLTGKNKTANQQVA